MRTYLAWAITSLVVLTAGCGKTEIAAPPVRADADLVGRFQFIGSKQVAGDPKAAALNEITALPTTAPFIEETLRKLATTPYRIYKTHFPVRTNDFGAVIRPILEDLLHAESYAEMRGPTNHVPEVLLAVHLDQHRSDYWRTNLANILSDWTAIPVKNIQAEGFQGWELKKHHNPNCIRFFRAGDWTLFGWGQDDIKLQSEMLRRIKTTGRPAPPLKDVWLDCWVDWPRITSYHHVSLPVELPKMHLTLEGKKEFIRPKLVLQYPQPLNITLDPWRIPTNIINNTVVSLSAIRGISPWLSQLPVFKAAGMGTLPNEWFSWVDTKNPFDMSFAAPVTDGAKLLKRISPGVVSLINSNFPKYRINGQAVANTNGDVIIRNLLFFKPHLGIVHEPEGEFLLGRLFPRQAHKNPLPPELVREIINKPKLVYYDWEITNERLNHWRMMNQLFSMMLGISLPDPNSAVQKWLIAVTPKMSACGTEVTLTAPNELTLIRNAPVGFSAAELVWLAYWLDAPNFPLDVHYPRPTFPSGRPVPVANPPPPSTPVSSKR
jgi:hypothetical protein